LILFQGLFIDGAVTGIGCATSSDVGFVIATVVALKMILLGSATLTEITSKGVVAVRAFAVMLLLSVMLFFGGIIGLYFLPLFTGTAGYYAILAFGASAMMWLAIEVLLPHFCLPYHTYYSLIRHYLSLIFSQLWCCGTCGNECGVPSDSPSCLLHSPHRAFWKNPTKILVMLNGLRRTFPWDFCFH
jgi:hypothetical protein